MNTINKWSKEIYFVLAAVGAAVGLGNLWRFPYMAYENGGGAFFIPYIICLLFVGFPLIFLETFLGKWGKGSVANAFYKTNKTWTWIGWWALINSLVIVFYYAVVLSFAVQYVVYSFTEQWGQDSSSFFVNNILHLTEGPFDFGNFNFVNIIALLLVWIIIYFIGRSSTKGLSRVLRITVPLPLILMIILSSKSLSMPGGIQGIKYFLTPRISEVFNIGIWTAAASQVILSLGLGMGQIVAYASRKKDNSGIIKSGIVIGSLDIFFSFMAGITVFATLGYLAKMQGIHITDLEIEGIFLAFVTYPTAISNLPLAPLWGIIFFTMLLSLGIDSVFAVIEANITGFLEFKNSKSKNKLALILCIVCFIGGLIFTIGPGLYWLDIVDHWVANYSIAAIIIMECIIFGRLLKLEDILANIKESIPLKVLKSWKTLIGIIVPLVLLMIFGIQFVQELFQPYGGYPTIALLIGGWLVFLLTIMISVFIAKSYNNKHESLNIK